MNSALIGRTNDEALDLTVIILQKDEALHIKRCLDGLKGLSPSRVFVVDCFSTDGSDKIAKELGADVVYHKWPGLQSVQFNWALDNLKITTKWVLRLDADEYLTQESVEWLRHNVPKIAADVNALEFTLERKFMGGVIRHGTNGIPMVRMFRYGEGRYMETLMDERIVFAGKKQSVPVVFYDDNLNSLGWWKDKHRRYAKREALQAIAGTFQDSRKAKYYRLPRYFRAVAYFCVRYFVKLGFLDGFVGLRWNFWQGLWYRWLVDREIGKIT